MSRGVFFCCIVIGLIPFAAFATDYSGTSYIVQDPVISIYGGNSSSTSFEKLWSGGQLAIGESSSTSFIVRSGFLYFTSTTTSTGGCVTDCGGGGGGGGGTGKASIRFSGLAYLDGVVTLLQDATRVASTTANGVDASFALQLDTLDPGQYIFGLYAEDRDCRQSRLVTYAITLAPDTITTVANIFISPTIALNKSEVAKGDPITAFGFTIPSANVDFFLSPPAFPSPTGADATGRYIEYLDTAALASVSYDIQSQARLGNLTSASSVLKSFLVGTRNVLIDVGSQCHLCAGRGDLNSDCRVNLTDFSIAAFWWEQLPLSPTFALKEIERLNGDGRIDLTDFSIMAYYWTG